MADSEREDSYQPTTGISLTPQARRFGYEFPVYASDTVFRSYCITTGIPSKHSQSLDGRIHSLLESCYNGMIKRLATDDSFVYYRFTHWHWPRTRPQARKQTQAALGARLFIDPSNDAPWLYIFSPNVDEIDTFEATSYAHTTESDSDSVASEPDSSG